jgi:hypothetical protein
MAETHFVLSQFWAQHFNRKRAHDRGPVTVRKLRAWIDEPKSRGLPEEVQNLVILVWAEQQQLAFTLHGGPVTTSLDDMRDELELKPQKLPTPEVWQVAVRRAHDIFGIPASALLNAANVAQLVGALREKAQGARANAHALVERLTAVQRDFGLDAAQTRRGRTANSLQRLLERITAAEPEAVIEVFATMPGDTSDPAMGRSVSQSSAVVGALTSTAWNLFEAVERLGDDRHVAGQAIRARVADALEADELAAPLAVALKGAQEDAVRLLAPPAPDMPTTGVHPRGERWREIHAKSQLASAQAIATLREYLESLNTTQRDRVRVSWRVEDKD